MVLATETNDRLRGMIMAKVNANLTIENITKMAEEIAARCGIPMRDAMDLAEFYLEYAVKAN